MTASPPGLTERQRDVWRLMAAGLGARRIATILGISRSTAQEHMDAIARKLERQEHA